MDSEKPRKGHGLRADLNGDREMTAAKKQPIKERRKAMRQSMKFLVLNSELGWIV